MPAPLMLAAMIAAALAFAFLATAVLAFKRRRPIGLLTSFLVMLLMAAIAALLGTISVATQGYRALTREEVAATILVRPTDTQRFDAEFTFPDGGTATFDLAGDQIYVDAHVLKWKPLANVLGLHTAYELDRVGGRYVELDAERDSLRTIYSLSRSKPVDMFTLRRRWSLLAPLLDAEYGSGTFLTADKPATLEVRVSTSGLLLRRKVEPQR